jgi:hypothetical protein
MEAIRSDLLKGTILVARVSWAAFVSSLNKETEPNRSHILADDVTPASCFDQI